MNQENPLIALDGLPLSERRKLTNTILTAYQRLTSDSGESIDFSPDADVKELLSGDTEPNQRFDARALQNRDRSRDSYVLQMQKIAANPDYDRLSTSKSPSFGAPMVFSRGVAIPAKQSGRKEVITMSDGKGGTVKIPAVYAVVEAASLLASHDASGNKVDAYGGEQGLMALNNGRTAALKLAYKKSTADGYSAAMYQEALKQDADSHGVDVSVIESMKEPVLVRVFAEASLQGINDPGAASNEKVGAELSDSERAKTDASKLTSSVLMLHNGGDINSLANRDFVKSYINAVGGADAVGDMQTADGGLSASGVRRIESALVARAYGDDATLNDLTESPDSELKSLGDTLKQVAGRWSVMKEAAQGGLIASSMDITTQLNEAIALIRKSRREGSSIAELVGQNSLFTGQLNPVTEALLRMFYRGGDMNRIRSAEKIKAALNGYLEKAMQSTAGADMFGHVANPIAEIDQQKNLLESDELAAKSQRSMFDSADFFNDCADDFDSEEYVLDAVVELSLLERRKLTNEVLAGIEQLQSGELKLLERRKVTNQVLDGIKLLGGATADKLENLPSPEPAISEPALVVPLDGTDIRAEVEQALADIEAEKADKEAQKEREGIVHLTIPAIHTIDFHKEMRKAIIDNKGLVAIDDVKKAFEQLMRNKEAVLEQLKKHKKDELIRFSGSYYPNENKDFQVKQAYNAFVSSFAYFTVDSITYSYGQDYERDVIKPYVDKLTQEDLIKWTEDIHKARAEYAAKKAAFTKAMNNPETLEEYEQFIKNQGKEKLSPAQLAQYDQLKASTIIAQQKTEVEQKQEQQSVVKNEHGAIAYSLAQTTHAKKGITLYVVRLTGDRLDKEAFYDLSAKAKKLGGYYSSYRGQGAIPGFQFESEADRTSFTKLLDGESVDITDKIEEQQTEKEESRVDKLLALAEKMEADAKEILDQDRKTNTARRASIASSIEERARGNIAFAKTLRRIAEGVREGNVQYLAGMSQATQLEALYSSLSSARSKYIYSGQFKNLTYNNRQNLEKSLSSGSASQDHMDAMLANVTLPKPSLWRNDMRRIAEKMKGKKGYAKTAQQLERLSWSADENKIQPVPLEIAQKVLEFREANKTGPNAVYEGWQVDGDVANLKRFSRMGIDTDEHLRMALRELLSLKESREKADPLKQMERNLIGKYKDIEWFNTPDTAAMRVARLAYIHPNHKVLEPSAGFGHLVDAVAALGVPKDKIDCVELSYDLSDALKLKGYQVVHNGDFLSYNKGGYDRIIMNPPFSNNQDIMHVMHAFKLLKSGGRLVSIMSSMAGERDDRKNKAFKKFLELHSVDGEKLPDGTFLKSINSTGVSTKIIVLEKNANLSTQDRMDAEGETTPPWFVLASVDNLPSASIEAMGYTEFSKELSELKSSENGDIRAYYFEAKRYGLPDEKIHQILLSGELPESVKLEIDGLRMKAEFVASEPDSEDENNSADSNADDLAYLSSNPDFIPTHTLEDGTEVEPHPENADGFLDAFGNEYQDESAIVIPDAGNPKPMPPANEPLPTIEYLDAPSGGKDFGRINEQALGIGGLLDIPIRIEKSAWDGGLSQKLDRAASISKCGIGGGGIAHVKFVTLFHKEIYKKGNVFLLVATSSYRDTQIGTAVLSIKESDYGGCYEVIRGIGALSGTESEINAEKALRGSELVWKQGAASVEKSETDLPFITFSKPFSPQKLFEKTSIWNARGRVEDYYAKLTNVEVADLWAWVKFVNFLVRHPNYRYYSWDTSKTVHGGLNVALKQTGGEDHLNEIKEHLEQRGLYEDADNSFMIDVNAIQKWIDGKNKSALAASNPSDEDAHEESDKPNAEAIPDEVTIQLSSGMNDSLDQTSENYRFADTGYIAGSKKELAAQRIKMARAKGELVRVKDIDWDEIEENPRSANALINKSNILGKPDWKALKESGMTPQAAFLIDKVYRSIAQKPEPDTPEARKAYVMGLETLRDRLEKLKTPEEVSNLLFNELRIELTGIKFTAEEESEYKRLDELSKQARHERMIEVQKGGNRNNALVAELTQKAGDLEKARIAIYTQANERQTNSLEFKAWSSFGEKFKGVLKHRYSNTGSKAFADHYWNAKNGKPANWDWAISEKTETESNTDEEKQDKKSKKSKFALVVSPSFERVGGRSISAESTLALKKAFNLRDVQSGNYVLKDKASAEFHVSRCAEAFADLADILGIQDSRISLGGRLAMAFGARGSGDALAHYEPVERVINMTKMSGGGSLAHEWFHAFDNLLVEYMGESAGKVGNYLSDNPSLTLKPVVKSAFENLRSAMMSGAEREPMTIAFKESDRAFARLSFDGGKTPMYVSLRTAKTLQEAIDWLERQNYRYKRGALETWLKLICAYHSKEGETTANFLMGKGASKFYRDAQELDKGRSKPYWSTMLEMAARAFSAYTEDKLREKGCKNDYLSNHSSNSVAEYVSARARPFPEGSERTVINAAFDNLFEALRENQILDSIYAAMDEGFPDPGPVSCFKRTWSISRC